MMRFIQQDTVFGEIKEPLSRNFYIYGNGNPLKYVDPSGHENKIKNNLDGGGRDEVDIRCNSGAPDNPLKKFFNWIKNGFKSLVGKPNLPTPNGSEINSLTKVGSEFGRDFTAPKVSVSRHGQLTNGKYTIDSKGMDPHISGKTSTGKSQFLYGVDAEKTVLDAAAYADKFNLWKGNKARVPVMNGPVGVHGGTGELTYYINIYRTNTGYVHGAPASPEK